MEFITFVPKFTRPMRPMPVPSRAALTAMAVSRLKGAARAAFDAAVSIVDTLAGAFRCIRPKNGVPVAAAEQREALVHWGRVPEGPLEPEMAAIVLDMEEHLRDWIVLPNTPRAETPVAPAEEAEDEPLPESSFMALYGSGARRAGEEEEEEGE